MLFRMFVEGMNPSGNSLRNGLTFCAIITCGPGQPISGTEMEYTVPISAISRRPNRTVQWTTIVRCFGLILGAAFAVLALLDLDSSKDQKSLVDGNHSKQNLSVWASQWCVKIASNTGKEIFTRTDSLKQLLDMPSSSKIGELTEQQLLQLPARPMLTKLNMEGGEAEVIFLRGRHWEHDNFTDIATLKDIHAAYIRGSVPTAPQESDDILNSTFVDEVAMWSLRRMLLTSSLNSGDVQSGGPDSPTVVPNAYVTGVWQMICILLGCS